MAFTLYDLVKACVLFLNAVAILNERFLRTVGWEKPQPDAPFTFKNRLLVLLHGDVKMIMQMPLIWVNMLLIVFEILLG